MGWPPSELVRTVQAASAMAQCDTCGNHYERSFEITVDGRTYTFDCFECAAHELAPSCESCGVRILGHGVQSDDRMFCSAHCARAGGVQGVTSHVETGQPRGW